MDQRIGVRRVPEKLHLSRLFGVDQFGGGVSTSERHHLRFSTIVTMQLEQLASDLIAIKNLKRIFETRKDTEEEEREMYN